MFGVLKSQPLLHCRIKSDALNFTCTNLKEIKKKYIQEISHSNIISQIDLAQPLTHNSNAGNFALEGSIKSAKK